MDESNQQRLDQVKRWWNSTVIRLVVVFGVIFLLLWATAQMGAGSQ